MGIMFFFFLGGGGWVGGWVGGQPRMEIVGFKDIISYGRGEVICNNVDYVIRV